MVETARQPGPVADLWEWQFRGSCRTVSPEVFFHPEGERGPARRRRDERAKQVCATCPVLEQCAWIAAGQPEPHYTPKGQSWHGTDRQVRGAMMAVLRHDEAVIAPSAFLADLAVQENEVFATLQKLDAPLEQRERALAGLLSDGLAMHDQDGIRLPS